MRGGAALADVDIELPFIGEQPHTPRCETYHRVVYAKGYWRHGDADDELTHVTCTIRQLAATQPSKCLAPDQLGDVASNLQPALGLYELHKVTQRLLRPKGGATTEAKNRSLAGNMAEIAARVKPQLTGEALAAFEAVRSAVREETEQTIVS